MNLSKKDLEYLVEGTENLIKDYERQRANTNSGTKWSELSMAIEFLEHLLTDLRIYLEDATYPPTPVPYCI